MAGDNAVIIKRIKKGGHGGHHGGAWKVAYADFVTAMMAFFLLMWLINTTTPEQKRGIADYFAPQSIAQTVSRLGRRAGRQGDGRGQRPCRRRPVGDAETVPALAAPRSAQGAGQRARPRAAPTRNSRQRQCRARIRPGRRIRPCRRSHPSGDPGQSRHRQSLPPGDHRETPQGLRIQLVDQDGRPMFQQGTAEPMPYTKKLLAAIGGIIDACPTGFPSAGHTSGNDVDRRERRPMGTVGRPRQRGPRPAAGGRAFQRPDLRSGGQGRFRAACCRKTPTPAPTAGFPSCDARSPAGPATGINSELGQTPLDGGLRNHKQKSSLRQ